MSRDFEKEYKQFAQMEAPDLWDRIEAGLKEKDVPEQEKTVVVQENGNKKKSVLAIFRKYQAVAAALLCLIIMIPAVLLMRQVGVKSEAADCASAEMPMQFAGVAAEEAPAEQMTAEETACEESVQEFTEKAEYETAPTEDAAPAEEFMFAENASFAEDVAPEEDLAEKESASEEALDVKGETLRKDKEAENEILEHVEVKITGRSKSLEENSQDEMGIIYRAQVLAYAGEELAEGEEITFFVSAYTSFAYRKDKKYELDLRVCEGEEYAYIVETVY